MTPLQVSINRSLALIVQRDALREAAKAMMKYIDEAYLVRDIKANEVDAVWNEMQFAADLKKMESAIAKAEEPEQG